VLGVVGREHQRERPGRRLLGQGPELVGGGAGGELGQVAPLELGPALRVVREPLSQLGARRHVAGALARIGTTPALQRLGVALRDSDPRVRLAVAQALASCPHPIARSALERLSLDPVAAVASAARAHLGR